MHAYCRLLLGFAPKLKVLTISSLVQVSRKRIHLRCRNSSEAESPDSKGYLAMYPTILSELKTNDRQKYVPCPAKRLKEYLDYNLDNSSAFYALNFMELYRGFAAVPPSEEDIRLAYIMAWCINILKATILVMDDLLDNSLFRRSQPCWHRVGDNNGILAFNDSFVVNYYVLKLLDIHFHDKFYYRDTLDTINYMMYYTQIAQYQDLEMSNSFKKTRNLDIFTVDGYDELCLNKSLPCCWYPSTWISMLMNDINSPEIRRKVSEIVNQISLFYQDVDDYRDCYQTKKGEICSTDIENGQCSWLICHALEVANPQQRRILQECYGIPEKDKIDAVVRVYNEVGMKNRFQQHFEKTKHGLEKNIQQLPEAVPKHAFINLLEFITASHVEYKAA